MEEIIEQWLDVPNYEGLYKISNLGRVISLNYNKQSFCKVMASVCDKNGYKVVKLWKNKKGNLYKVHRLVAIAFVENPNNLPQVHHIDHDKSNANINNLMWVTTSENIKFNYSTGGQVGKSNMKGRLGKDHPLSKPVKRISLDGKEEKLFEGLMDAERETHKGCASHILKVIKGKLKKHAGYRWQYV